MEAAHPVYARGPVETGGPGAVVDVHRAVLSRPAVHADAVVRSQRVGARRAVVANARSHRALVHVHLARLARPLGRTRARVTVHAVHARAAVETCVRYAVIDVLLAVFAPETYKGGKTTGSLKNACLYNLDNNMITSSISSTAQYNIMRCTIYSSKPPAQYMHGDHAARLKIHVHLTPASGRPSLASQ